MLNNTLLPQKKEFVGINAIRFIAAFWVLIFHSSIHFGKINSLFIIQPIIDQGALAMALFFILSGFVLAYRYRDFQTKQDVVLFYAARFARLYPTYLFIGLITIWQLQDNSLDFVVIKRLGLTGEIILSVGAVCFFLCLFQAWLPSLFGVWNFGGSWALSVESFFYMLFPLIRTKLTKLSDRSLFSIIYVMPILMLLILSGMTISLKSGAEAIWFYVLPIFRLPEFIFGVAGYILFVERYVYIDKLKIMILFSTPLLFVAIMTINLPGLIDYNWLAAIPFMGIIIFSLGLDFFNKFKNIINYLGRTSYCIYISQLFTIPILKKYKENISTESAWMTLVVSTLLMAMLIYHFIEKRSYQPTLRRMLF